MRFSKCNSDGGRTVRAKKNCNAQRVAGLCCLLWPGLVSADGGISAGAQAMLLIIAALVTLGIMLGSVGAWFVKKKRGIVSVLITFVTLSVTPVALFLLYLWYIQRPLP